MQIFVYRHHQNKVEDNVSIEELPAILRDENNVVWIDLEAATTEEEDAVLSNLLHLHPLTIEDCRTDHSEPKIEEFPDYLYLIVHGVRRDKTSARNFTTKELDLCLGKNFLMTYHHESFLSIDAVKQQITASPLACQRGAAYLMHQVLDQLIDLYAPVIDGYETYVTKLEDRIFALKKADNRILSEIVKAKRNTMKMRRIASRQLDILYRLSHGEFPQINEHLLPFYRDVYDHLQRVSDLAENYRDLMSSLMDTYLSVISNKTNDVMKTLTIFSAIMLPLTVIAGVYGMNFDNMPELHTRYGYFGALALMAIVALVLAIYFWRKGWFDSSEQTLEVDDE